MKRFQCAGSACEATCCGGWVVSIDRKHYDLLAEKMRKTPETRQQFDENIKRVKGPTRSKARHALMVLNDHFCSFLSPDKLCGLQMRYGEEVLPNTCAQYPRVVSKSGMRWEMAGTPSCPEAARQLLLHADAMELDEVPAEVLSRGHLKQELPAHPSLPYARYHDELRNLVLDLLSDPRFTLGIRLALVAWFADRTRSFLYQSAETLDEAKLSAEVDAILDPAQRAMFAREFVNVTPSPSMAMRVVIAFMTRRSAPRLFDELRAKVLRTYAPSVQGDVVEGEDMERVGEEMLENYLARKARFAKLMPRIEQSLTNLAKSFWVRNWYFLAPDLLAHHMELLVLLTVARFLILGHPLLAEIESVPPAQRDELLDRAIVDSVFRFSRSFEHAEEGLKRLREMLQKRHLVTLAHTVSLALF